MINFLRRIRQKLITENKPSVYLIYAIGEVVLVVFGILIAFQIDNWNEQKKSISTQKASVGKLKFDLIADIERFNDLDSIYDLWKTQVDFILSEILTGSRDKLNGNEEYTIGRSSVYYVTLKKTMYSEMINTGLFYQFNNQELESSIGEYYEIAEFELTKLNRDNQNLNDYVLDRSSWEQKNRSFRLLRGRYIDDMDWSWLQDPNSKEFKELENRVLWFDYNIKENQRVLSLLKEKAQRTILQIDKFMDD
jgi:hypothetical protein